MNRARLLALGAVMGVVLVASAGKAAAHIDPINPNGCNGSGTWRSGTVPPVDAQQIGDQLVKIPRSDTVDWKGSVKKPPGGYSGEVSIDLPWPFRGWQIDSWKGNSKNPGTSGAKKYNLPSWVPAGAEFKVTGSHTDENGTCSGYVKLEIDGGPFDSPAAPISLVATVATGAGLFGTIRPLFRRATA